MWSRLSINDCLARKVNDLITAVVVSLHSEFVVSHADNLPLAAGAAAKDLRFAEFHPERSLAQPVLRLQLERLLVLLALPWAWRRRKAYLPLISQTEQDKASLTLQSP